MFQQNYSKKERRELKALEKLADKSARQRKKKFKKIFKKSIVGACVALFVFFIWKSANAPLDPAQDPKNILQIQDDDWMKGNKDAPVQLIEYLDFECEVCRTYHPLIKQLKQDMGDDLLVVTRYFPLPGHKNSMNAALAVEAAGKQ